MHIHFIGIGGISMSALAKICLSKGYIVSGSDAQESKIVKDLKKQGANISIGHKKENITNDINLLVYTAAIKEDNEELKEAQLRNIKTMSRAKFLGELMKDYKNSIAVSGTHGKTSTTSMISLIFEHSGLDPTILVGGNLKDIGGNTKIGNSENFITEACEYVDSFLEFNPKISVVLNIEADHLDYFSCLDDIKDSFNRFGRLLPKNGYLIVNGDDKNCIDILHNIDANIIKYGQGKDNDLIIKGIKFNELGHGIFSIEFKGKDLGEFNLSIPGIHNIYNAASAIAVGIVSNIPIDKIKSNIYKYTGVGRRFEYKGKYKDAIIIDDYAHHPTEIKATLSAAKNMCKGKLWCIFQPHTYTRTYSLLDEFSNSFFDADKVIITDIYAAREKDTGLVHSSDLANRLKEHNIDALYIKSFDDIAKYICENVNKNDVVITTGAGNIYQVADIILKNEA
ncbi:UDP-N-acetylmuramate--L-alanine ligase [Tepidibacter formicigenes]|jgi:UDP-N-acetylmuramate--alanine ligase|uniref:UDP-N-acetylmuramate--L-alanine ligase n=1 Tax=Tepidibacter formicigenes DSM 15518 TaxID=1123349 RepID=A0A1M6NRV5_9FIRM|nr:UDP-N-acetylmuramate--L-alanine ligase [Tepidibacter formicigenes]SHJ98467.1 UDP-N-acetylmuramate--L-alanine ligase [Tepidibacter formicigenes DSM 15518]